jgi:hypothetical protein
MSGGSVCPWRTEGNERSGASAPASGITIERHGTWLYGSSHDGGGTQGWPNPDQKERPVLLPAFSVGLEQRLHSLLEDKASAAEQQQGTCLGALRCLAVTSTVQETTPRASGQC